jgi:hypothetical protein
MSARNVRPGHGLRFESETKGERSERDKTTAPGAAGGGGARRPGPGPARRAHPSVIDWSHELLGRGFRHRQGWFTSTGWWHDLHGWAPGTHTPRSPQGPSGVPMERNRKHRTTRPRADSAPTPATTPAFLVGEGGRCSSVVGASEHVDRNPRYGSKCRDFHDWTPARSSWVDCRQFASRFSPARAMSGHPMIQHQGGALHRSDQPDASPPSVEQPSVTTMDPSGPQR